MRQYVWNIIIWIDQGVNVVFMRGDPDETVSSRAAKAQRKGHRWGCVLCRFMDLFDKDHCEKNIEPDEGERLA